MNFEDRALTLDAVQQAQRRVAELDTMATRRIALGKGDRDAVYADLMAEAWGDHADDEDQDRAETAA